MFLAMKESHEQEVKLSTIGNFFLNWFFPSEIWQQLRESFAIFLNAHCFVRTITAAYISQGQSKNWHMMVCRDGEHDYAPTAIGDTVPYNDRNILWGKHNGSVHLPPIYQYSLSAKSVQMLSSKTCWKRFPKCCLLILCFWKFSYIGIKIRLQEFLR